MRKTLKLLLLYDKLKTNNKEGNGVEIDEDR